MKTESSRVRLGVLGIAAMSLFAALFARLWFLQVVSADDLRVAANSMSIRTVRVPAPRGRILDRNGMVLVDNRPSLVVTVDWQRYRKLTPSAQARMLDRLASALTRSAPAEPVTAEELQYRIDDQRYSRFLPVPVAKDASEQLAIYIAEHQDDLPTVTASRVMVRAYHFGALLSHVLGYVGSLSDPEWRRVQADPDPQKPYSQNDQIGKTGVEATLESQLRGVPGAIRYEVDARNQPLRQVDRTDPVPGNDVYLTIDMRMQALAETSLQAGLLRARATPTSLGPPPAPAGSTVLLDPRNGQLLAMASYPTFSPSDFSSGISSTRYKELNSPGSQYPLTNRAVQGTYAPGSTFKLATAYAGLKLGLIKPEDRISDPGFFDIPNCGGPGCQKYNAGKAAHGSVNLQRALTVSSDVYFYGLGFRIWAARDQLGSSKALQDAVRDFGFDEKTGVELPSELRGRIPTPGWLREFDRAIHGGHATTAGRWQAGDNLNVAVGQGAVQVTPLQIADAYATFANGGTLYRPSLVLKVTGSPRTDRPAPVVSTFHPRPVRRLQFPPGAREAMLAGFAGVTTDPGGTATSAFQGFPTNAPVAGKTGTAQVGKDPKTGAERQDNSLFAGFMPVNDPRYLGVTVIEAGGFGSDAAAPVVRNILQPIATNDLPGIPPGGLFNAEEVLKTQTNLAQRGPAD